MVVDGPFSEAKESIGGFTIIDVPDLDAAIAMVKEWPAIGLPGVAVEIRPMVEDYSQFEQTSETARRPEPRAGRGRCSCALSLSKGRPSLRTRSSRASYAARPA